MSSDPTPGRGRLTRHAPARPSGVLYFVVTLLSFRQFFAANSLPLRATWLGIAAITILLIVHALRRSTPSSRLWRLGLALYSVVLLTYFVGQPETGIQPIVLFAGAGFLDSAYRVFLLRTDSPLPRTGANEPHHDRPNRP